MLRKAIFSVLVCFTITSGCQKNTVAEVFPESQASLSASCAELVIPNEYLIRYKSGKTEVVTSESIDHFIANTLNVKIDQISLVELHKSIRIDPNQAPLRVANSTPLPSQSWGQDIIESSYAYASGFTGSGVTIAVIDTAVDIDHPALKNQIAINLPEQEGLEGQDDDNNGLIDDIYGWDFYWDQKIDSQTAFHEHGTHVAGIISGNTSAWRGVAPDARIIPISFMSNDGYGNVASAVNSIRYAKSRGAQIINASWGGPTCSSILEQEIKSVTESGILFVAASGNNGSDLDWSPQYPATFNFPLQITVAATRPSDHLAGFSNTSFRIVHLGAPGDGIWSTLPSGQFGYLSGTSMAAPFVSGAAAVLLSARPDLSPQIIRQAILVGVDPRDYRVQTTGRLNLRRSLDHILSR